MTEKPAVFQPPVLSSSRMLAIGTGLFLAGMVVQVLLSPRPFGLDFVLTNQWIFWPSALVSDAAKTVGAVLAAGAFIVRAVLADSRWGSTRR